MRSETTDTISENISTSLAKMRSIDARNYPDPQENENQFRDYVETDYHVVRAIHRFIRVWSINKNEILHLTAVNIVTTLLMEALVRTLISRLMHDSNGYDFIIYDSLGAHINRQSLTNIWITTVTSLFGGPILYLSARSTRYFYFITFGLIVSAISQGFTAVSLGWTHGMNQSVQVRLLFDFCYTASVKFLLFELARRPLLAIRPRFSFRTGSIRFIQDLLTTLIRVSFLNLFGLKG